MSTFTPPREPVRFFDGADLAKLRELRRAVDEAEADSQGGVPLLMGEVAEADTARDAYNEYLAEAESRAQVVVVQALSRKQWRSLVAAHPPREGNEEDKAIGVNEDAFAEALVPASIHDATPPFATPADQTAFLESLSDAQFMTLYTTAFALNRSFGEDPKALSAPSPSSSETAS